MSPVGHRDLWTGQGWVDFSAAWRTGSISGSQDHSGEPACTAGGHHITAGASTRERLPSPSPVHSPSQEAFAVCICRKGDRGALRGLAPRPLSWSDWAGVRSQTCVAVGEDPQDRAGLGVTERGSGNVTAERAPGGPNS